MITAGRLENLRPVLVNITKIVFFFLEFTIHFIDFWIPVPGIHPSSRACETALRTRLYGNSVLTLFVYLHTAVLNKLTCTVTDLRLRHRCVPDMPIHCGKNVFFFSYFSLSFIFSPRTACVFTIKIIFYARILTITREYVFGYIAAAGNSYSDVSFIYSISS